MIIKKFIYDYIKLMDEIRKEKRRRAMEDSDDDDDDNPFHNNSRFTPGPAARNAATPTSIRPGSVAGRSQASATKSAVGGGPVNIQTGGGRGGQAAAPPTNEFFEFLGEGTAEY